VLIPREHIKNAAGLTAEHKGLMGHIWETIPKIAEQLGIAGGFRVITNSGEDAGQTVWHLHFHIMGGKKLCVLG
jgi:histidine triad (HIT) family protein